MSYEKSLKVVAIIQARLTSTRFPKKILKKVNGRSILEHVVDRVSQAVFIDTVVVASPHKIPLNLKCDTFIGKEHNVLDRYYQCAKKYNADVIVRITSDCPYIDPYIINLAFIYFQNHNFPYICFAPVDGLDVEIFSFLMLKRAWEEVTSLYDKEHVTPYMRRYTKISVDTKEDLEKVRGMNGL